MSMAKQGWTLTGRGVLAIAVGFFGVVIAVNVTMATLAVGGFPGLVTANPYVEAQKYDAEQKAEKALGWSFGFAWEAGALRVAVTGPEGERVRGLDLVARVGRPATLAEDREARFVEDGAGYAAALALPAGMWRVDLTATRSDGAVYTIADEVWISPDAATAPAKGAGEATE